MTEIIPTRRTPNTASRQARPDVVADSGVASTISGTRIGTAGRIVAALALLGVLSCGKSAVSSCEGSSPESSFSLSSTDEGRNMTLQEADEYLAKRRAAADKKYQGFYCTGTQIAEGKCF